MGGEQHAKQPYRRRVLAARHAVWCRFLRVLEVLAAKGPCLVTKLNHHAERLNLQVGMGAANLWRQQRDSSAVWLRDIYCELVSFSHQ